MCRLTGQTDVLKHRTSCEVLTHRTNWCVKTQDKLWCVKSQDKLWCVKSQDKLWCVKTQDRLRCVEPKTNYDIYNSEKNNLLFDFDFAVTTTTNRQLQWRSTNKKTNLRTSSNCCTICNTSASSSSSPVKYDSCSINTSWTSHQTHHRSYQGSVFTGQMTKPSVSKHWRKIGPRARLQSHQVNPTVLTIIQHICSIKNIYKHKIHTDKHK